MKGLSFRSMLLNLFFQTAIFLYLADNDTSWMILFSSGVGLAIEVWKLRKAIKSMSLQPQPGSRLPKLVIVPADSYALSETKLYDEEAMRYLSLAMYPLVVGYSLYSLAYDSHKSWYSWLLGSTVNFVYSFGFVLMTPQIFINYKLKSTAHMPWKVRRDALRRHTLLCARVCVCRAPRIAVTGCVVRGRWLLLFTDVYVQSAQHFHRRLVRVHHQDAHDASPLVLARRLHLFDLPLSALDLRRGLK